MAGGFREITKGWFGRKELGRQNSRMRERGNVFFTLFGAVAVVGVLGAGIMSTMRGPLTTMVEVNRIEETKAEMGVGLRLLLLNAINQDDDVLTEPNQPASCSGMPTGAGCVPIGGPAKQKDAWGSYYAYCAWNNGSDNDAIGSLIHKGGASTNNIAVALISAGPDRKFDTSCADASTFITPSDGGGDDIVRKYNYNDAVAGSDGLWALQAGASGDEARVEEEISVGGGTGSVSTFEGSGAFGENVRTEGEIQTDVVSPHPSNSLDYIEFTGSVLLPEVTGLSCGANEGAIAFDASEDIVAFCDGSSWQPLGKKFWIADANGIRNNDALAAHVGIGTASSSAYSFYVNGGSATDTLKATGIVDFDSTLNVDGAATLNDSLEVTSDTKLNAKLDVVGATELDATLGVDSTSEFRGDVTVISDVFVNKTATGGGNITAEDAITATEGDITATAGNVVATAGNVEATAGDVTAGQDVIAERHVKATTGDVEAVAGDVVATAGNVEAVEGNIIALGTSGKVVGKSFHRGSDGALDFSDIEACDPESEKTVWSTVSGWGCEPDNGTGTGDDGEMTLKDVLGRGNDAEGQDAEDFGKVGADEYCDAGMSSCVSSAELIEGSQIWKRNGVDPTKVYYNDGKVGIGTDDPYSKLQVIAATSAVPAGTFNSPVLNSDSVWLSTLGVNGTSVDTGDVLTTNQIARMYFATGSAQRAAIEAARDSSNGYNGYLAFRTRDNSTAPFMHERMRIDAFGNVGIGVGSATAAATKLDINGTLKIGDGTELCNVTAHEGAIKYDPDDDEFYVCRLASTGWEPIGSGSGGSGGSGGGATKGLQVGNSTSSIPHGAYAKVTFNATPTKNDFGTGAWANNEFTVPVGEDGWYAITAFAGFPASASHSILTIKRDGSVIAYQRDVGTSVLTFTNASAVSYLAAGSVIHLEAYQAGGSTQALTNARLSLVKVGGGGSGSGSGGQDVSFSAKGNVAQSIPVATHTKANFTTENFDSNDNFDIASGRFTPTVAGKYILTAYGQFSTLDANAWAGVHIYKNGAQVQGGNYQRISAASGIGSTASTIVEANGTTDYFEIYVYHGGSSGAKDLNLVNFSGALIGGGGSGSGDSLWSDSGNGYIEYDVTDAGVKLQNISGMAQPALGLAEGMTWDADGDTLIIDGNITYTGTITDTSDRRLKTDVESLIEHGSMLDRINRVDTYSFRMKDNPHAAKEFGVMAQEIETIFPELVQTASDDMGTKSVNYVGLIAPMIEATKELSRKNAALEEQVALLNKIAAERDTQKASSLALWLILALFAGMGGTLIVIAHPKFKGRWERD